MAAVVGFGLSAGAGTAQGAVGFGVEFQSLEPDTGVADGSSTQLSAPLPANPTNAMTGVTSPVDGVIIAIQLKYKAPASPNRSLSFHVLAGNWTDPIGPFDATSRPAGFVSEELLQTSPPSTYRVASAVLTYRPQDRGRTIGIPVKAGERLAVAERPSVGGTPLPDDGLMYTKANAGDQYLLGSSPTSLPLPGQSVSYAQAGHSVVLLRAIVELDADGDSLGDETQDQCVGVKNDAVTLACPGAGAAAPAPAPVVVTDVRCRVPSVKGLSRTLAKRVLIAASCKLGKVKTRAIKKGKVGVVTAQGTKAGSILPKDTSVSVTLTKRKR